MVGRQHRTRRTGRHRIVAVVVMMTAPTMAAIPPRATPARGIPRPPVTREIPHVRNAEIESERRPVAILAITAVPPVRIRVGPGAVVIPVLAGAGVIRTGAVIVVITLTRIRSE